MRWRSRESYWLRLMHKMPSVAISISKPAPHRSSLSAAATFTTTTKTQASRQSPAFRIKLPQQTCHSIFQPTFGCRSARKTLRVFSWPSKIWSLVPTFQPTSASLAISLEVITSKSVQARRRRSIMLQQAIRAAATSTFGGIDPSAPASQD